MLYSSLILLHPLVALPVGKTLKFSVIDPVLRPILICSLYTASDFLSLKRQILISIKLYTQAKEMIIHISRYHNMLLFK